MTSETAQDLYAQMHRTEIAPRMRSLGFRGSAGTYVLPDEKRWLLIGFQKNRYSTTECVSFTVNVTTADKRIWAKAHAEQERVPPRPSGNLAYPWADTVRLGGLMPSGHDRWWEIGPACSGPSPAAEVLDAIERFAMPWMRQAAPRDHVTFTDAD